MEKIFERLEKIRRNSPLIHHITNYVTVNDCADITKNFGASPVMADAKEEVQEMVSLADALVLNIGTLSTEIVESMKLAGFAANKKGIPVILDVCGAGATTFRNEKCKELLSALSIEVVKGNISEIATIAGFNIKTKGVDASEVEVDKYNLAKKLAQDLEAVVVITGAEDVVSNGQDIYSIKNGTNIMGRVVGTGCMAASVIATFCAIDSDYAMAAASALVCYEIAGENAEKTSDGPGTFKTGLFDKISSLSEISVNKMKKIEKIG
ncbi:MAG: hydroxyethylthiazole kinase [Endomicrobiaceae bacterium]|nr:hydroxyethylthiazole kinase [Endomicrobiaceae bacterium]